MASSININQNNNDVTLQDNNGRLSITNNNTGTTINVTQPVTNVVTVATVGPQGPVGPIQTSGSFTGSFSGSFTGDLTGTASYALTASYLEGYISPFPFTGSAIISGSLEVTGSVSSTTGFTGSLQGTASNAVSASYALNATSASYAQTASYATNFIVSGSITGVDYIDFDTTAIVTQPTTGRLSWNDSDGTLDLGLKGGNVTLQIGQENVIRVVNKSGGNLLEANFQVVRVRSVSEGGAQGQRLAVVLAQADSDADSATTLGIVTETIPVNQEGFITIFGQVRGIDTTGAKSYGGLETWVDGDMLYLSPSHPGYLTNVKPTAPNHLVIIGYVEYAHQNNGKIFVKIDNGWELGELHDVRDLTTSASYGDILVKSGSVWTNSKQLTGSYGLTGSLTATSFTGSLQGTSSNALSASYAQTASYALNVNPAATASYAINALSASYAQTASYVQNAQTASYVQNAQTASYVLQAVSASYATSASQAQSSVSASYALSSSYAVSASQAQSSVSSSYAANATNALTASYLNTLNQDLTFNGNLTLNGTASISNLVVNQIAYSSGSNQLGDAADDTQTLYGTVRIPTGSLTLTGSFNSRAFGSDNFGYTTRFVSQSNQNIFVSGVGWMPLWTTGSLIGEYLTDGGYQYANGMFSGSVLLTGLGDLPIKVRQSGIFQTSGSDLLGISVTDSDSTSIGGTKTIQAQIQGTLMTGSSTEQYSFNINKTPSLNTIDLNIRKDNNIGDSIYLNLNDGSTGFSIYNTLPLTDPTYLFKVYRSSNATYGGDGSAIFTIFQNRIESNIPITGSFSGSFSGSFQGNGSGLTNIPASGITGLNLSQIATGSVSASVSTGTGLFTVNSGSSTFLFVSSSGNVGIGTTSSLSLFTIESNISSSVITENGVYLRNLIEPGAFSQTTPPSIVFEGKSKGGGSSIVSKARIGYQPPSGVSTPLGTIQYQAWNGSSYINYLNVGNGIVEFAAPNGTTDIQTSGNSGISGTRLLVRPAGPILGSSPISNHFGVSGTYTNSSIADRGENLISSFPTINQSGTATGIYRGLYVNPTLTSITSTDSWRSIEWSNNTGWGIYGSGSADSALRGNLIVGTLSTPSSRLQVRGSGATSATTALRVENTNASASLTITDDLNSQFFGNVGIRRSATSSLDVAGTTRLSGSFNTAISGSILTVIGSGSAQPIFTVQGSQGELFSITDSLSGSLFSVNDISGLPILEVFSDNTTLIGNYQDPMLITTAKVVQTNSGSFTVYSLPTASYDTAFFEYSVRSGSNARAGTIMAMQLGSTVNFTETTTTDFGDTTAVSFTVIVTGSNMALTGSSTSGAWTIKTIVRGL